MQSKEYTIQFLLTARWTTFSWSPSSEHGTHGFHRFCRICGFSLSLQKTTKLTELVQTHRKVRSSRKEVPAPWPTPFYTVSTTSMAWIISTAQLGLAAWLCSFPVPAHLLISWTWVTGKTPWFLSNN